MNFKVFGWLVAIVGSILALIGFPQVFPDFGKSREQQISEAMRETSKSFDSADCFFHGNNCDATYQVDSSTAVGPALFWGGIALLVLGIIIVASARPNTATR
jgi:uncharacterized membrane protein